MLPLTHCFHADEASGEDQAAAGKKRQQAKAPALHAVGGAEGPHSEGKKKRKEKRAAETLPTPAAEGAAGGSPSHSLPGSALQPVVSPPQGLSLAGTVPAASKKKKKKKKENGSALPAVPSATGASHSKPLEYQMTSGTGTSGAAAACDQVSHPQPVKKEARDVHHNGSAPSKMPMQGPPDASGVQQSKAASTNGNIKKAKKRRPEQAPGAGGGIKKHAKKQSKQKQ